MRILLVFSLGIILSFYLTEFIRRLWNISFTKKKLIHIPHSFIGLLISSLGVVLMLFGKSVFADPTNTLVATFLIGSGLGMVLHHLLASSFIISEQVEHRFVKTHETKFERLLEIMPGALIWIALASPIWLSFALPFAVAYLILLADIYWLVSALKISALIFREKKRTLDFASVLNFLARILS